MRTKIQDYDLERYYIGSISKSEENNEKILTEDLNPIYYDGKSIKLIRENKQCNLIGETKEFFDKLHDYDVIEILPDGSVLEIHNEEAEDTTFFITSKCNSNCIMCPSSDYSRMVGELPDESEIEEIARHIPKRTQHITITGGEPLLIGETFFKALDILKNNLYETEILLLTNGRIFCLDKYIDKLNKTAPERFILGIPLHSSDELLHDKITRSKGSFIQTVSGISKLIKNRFNVEIRIVVSKENILTITQTAKYIVEHFPNCFCVNFIGLEMLGNAALNNEVLWLPYKEVFEHIKPAVDILINAGINTGIYNLPLCAVEKRYWSICQRSISDYKRKYPEPCEKCVMNKSCGGVFAGSLRFALKDMKPFEV